MKNRIEELKERLFILDMLDIWQPSTYEEYDKISKELNALEKAVSNE